MTSATTAPICLEDRVHQAFKHSPYLMQKSLQCEAEPDGRVILRGEVASFFQKQMATEVVRKVDGIREIENRLEVIRN